MTATYQVPLFDLEEFTARPTMQPVDEARQAIIDEMRSLNNCPDCGDYLPNGLHVYDTNHGIVFNGWCATHLLCNNGANTDQLAWLEKHGFEVCDRFDQANWNMTTLKYWNAL